jgi:hypothetical protein
MSIAIYDVGGNLAGKYLAENAAGLMQQEFMLYFGIKVYG